MQALADIGLIGLAVMGQNLALNIHDHGFRVAVFNRTTSKITRFLENEARDTDIIGAFTPEEFGREHQAAAQDHLDDPGGRGGG